MKDDNGREVLSYPLKYWEGGKDKDLKVSITRCSGDVRLLYNEICGLWTEFNELMDELSDIETNIGATRERIKHSTGEEFKELRSELKELKGQKKTIRKEAESRGNDIIDKRFEAIKILLTDNGYAGKSGDITLFFKKEFWLSNTGIDTVSSFLEDCIFKDQKKKRVSNPK